MQISTIEHTNNTSNIHELSSRVLVRNLIVIVVTPRVTLYTSDDTLIRGQLLSSLESGFMLMQEQDSPRCQKMRLDIQSLPYR